MKQKIMLIYTIYSLHKVKHKTIESYQKTSGKNCAYNC